MAVLVDKTYQIVLRYTYQDGATITDADYEVAILRAKVLKRIAEEVGHISQGNLSAHIVGSVTES